MIAASLLKPKLYSKIKPKDFSDGLIHALSIKATTPDEYFH